MEVNNKPNVVHNCSVRATVSKATSAVQALVFRIAKIAKETFYFLVPSLRKDYEVFLVSQLNEQDSYGDSQIAHKFLRKQLSYQFNPVVTYVYMDTTQLTDFHGERMIHIMPFGSCTDETLTSRSPLGQFMKRVIACPQVKFLSLYTHNHEIRGEGWKEMDDNRLAFRYENATEVDFEARDEFFADF